jgi:hypothetical protein
LAEKPLLSKKTKNEETKRGQSPQSRDPPPSAAPPAMTDFAKLTVVQLKAECAKLKIDASGKKADLVER